MISRALLFTQNGWPLEVSPELKSLYRRRSELTVEGNYLLWGMRVVAPRKLQNRVLQELHSKHTGMGAYSTKSIARSYIWWPGMDTAIEELVGACKVCQRVKRAPPVALLHPWVWPEKPWQRVVSRASRSTSGLGEKGTSGHFRQVLVARWNAIIT